MAQDPVGIGTVANDGTGDTLRVAFGKLNANDAELFAAIAGTTTAAGVLALLLTVDGAGSGLDADLLDGQSAAAFAAAAHTHAQGDITGLAAALAAKLDASSYTAADVRTKLLTVDGAGSGIDADLLDGLSSAAFATAAHAHAIADVTGLQAALDGKGDLSSAVSVSVDSELALFSGTTGKLVKRASGTGLATLVAGVLALTDPATFAAAAHTHAIADTTGLQAALDAKLPSATYTAADVLSKLLTVDGSGSGLDADLLDGQSSAAFAAAAHTHAQSEVTGLVAALAAKLEASAYTAADVLSKLLTVDGAGSGLDADTLDGVSSAGYAAASHSHAIADVTSLQTALDTKITSVVQVSAVGATITQGFQLLNPTAAALNAQQYSPALLFSGNAWRTGTSVSQPHDWALYVVPVQGGAQTSSELRIAQRVNAGAFADRFTVASSGNVTLTRVSSGSWEATPIDILYGGTGLTTVGNAQVLISASNVISLLAAPAAGNYFLKHAGGIGGTPVWQELGISDVATLQTSLDAKLASASYTAADVLAKLLTVDGAGSGIDADLLDGNSSAAFLLASAYTAADVLAKLLTVDGAGSGIDADLLDGLSSAAFAQLTGATFSGVVIVPNGAVGAPSIGFASANNTGIYRTGGGSLGLAVAGVLTGAFNSNGQNTCLDGTVSLPAFALISDPDTGIYRISSNVLGVTCGGTMVLSIATAQFQISTTTVRFDTTTATTVGAAGGAAALPLTPVGYLTVSIAGTAAKIPYYNT